jgi:phospholipase/carboxylesterase/glyoxalase family protein
MSELGASDLGFVHRFLPVPRLQAAPTLLLLHGTGGDENDLLSLGQALLPTANRLSPRGKVLERGMPRFFCRLAEGVFDQEDLQLRTQELAQFIGVAAARYSFDPHRVIAVGYSNGANIAASLLLRQPELLAGAALFHPMVPFEPEPLPDLTAKPVFIAAGKNDAIVPEQNTQQLVTMFQSAGAEVSVYWHPGGHALIPAEVESAQRWLRASEAGSTERT